MRTTRDAATVTSSPPVTGKPRHYRSGIRPRRVVGVVGLAAVAAAVTGTVVTLEQGGARSSPALCTVTSPTSTYTLVPDQAANAATIGAVAGQLGLPDHAVTVALATAMQESKLRNVNYGDRDSIGLFQQRPSQGWGTADQIIQPSYAAAAFYGALAKIPGWETLDVAVAAQRVQRSADGTAYTRWEDEARALAVALTGQQPAKLACSGGDVTYHRSAAAVAAEVGTALGPTALSAGVPAVTAWKTATYLVANAYADGVTSVSYGGQTWTAKRGTWRADPGPVAVANTQVTFTVATPPSPAGAAGR